MHDSDRQNLARPTHIMIGMTCYANPFSEGPQRRNENKGKRRRLKLEISLHAVDIRQRANIRQKQPRGGGAYMQGLCPISI